MGSTRDPVDASVFQRLSVASRGAAADYLATSREALGRLLAEPEIDAAALRREAGSYARTLLFGDRHISVWAFTWAPGAKTAIHDHRCSCCFGILSGALQEVRYAACDDERAVLTGSAMRQAGFVACLLPNGPNIHQVVNAGDREAISLHIYGFDHSVHSSSVDREYRLAAPFSRGAARPRVDVREGALF